MATWYQRKFVKQLRKQGHYPKEIAKSVGLTIEDVRKPLQPHTVLKIRRDFQILKENDYTDKYIYQELSRWYGEKPLRIQRVVTGRSYKNIDFPSL